MNTITLNKRGKDKRTIPLSQVVIPDLWKIAQIKELEGYSLGDKSAKDLILECWRLCHDLLNELRERNGQSY